MLRLVVFRERQSLQFNELWPKNRLALPHSTPILSKIVSQLLLLKEGPKASYSTRD
jgi:hypothetical protein